ncbi:hypothetical protein HF851_12600 [Corynebacterium ammoniagenes]|nr:hypothetical protein [Corynebacterium ammoniagenes]
MSALPEVRRNTYLEIAGRGSAGSSELQVLAARLYIWNGYLASVIDRATGEVEVLLRNCMNEGFVEWNSAHPQNGSREWLCYPEGELAKVVAPAGKSRWPSMPTLKLWKVLPCMMITLLD